MARFSQSSFYDIKETIQPPRARQVVPLAGGVLARVRVLAMGRTDSAAVPPIRHATGGLRGLDPRRGRRSDRGDRGHGHRARDIDQHGAGFGRLTARVAARLLVDDRAEPAPSWNGLPHDPRGELISSSFETWLEALEARHLADLTFSEISRALRALSSAYVERRARLSAGAVLSGAGKRAAFALFYGPLHYLLVRHIVAALGAASVRTSAVVDLGCGTGAAGAACAGSFSAHLVGIDRHHWA